MFHIYNGYWHEIRTKSEILFLQLLLQQMVTSIIGNLQGYIFSFDALYMANDHG